jgi:hypothetical protein
MVCGFVQATEDYLNQQSNEDSTLSNRDMLLHLAQNVKARTC